jgi:hypothetical protein
MRLADAIVAGAVFLAACGKVEGSRDGAPTDHRDGNRSDDGGSVLTDAGSPDATPVACDGPDDCANPDDPCLLPGTCANDVCHFPQKDCSVARGAPPASCAFWRYQRAARSFRRHGSQ